MTDTGRHNDSITNDGPALGYDIGELPVKAAITTEMAVPGISARALFDQQHQDSEIMDKQPGMYLKYMPFSSGLTGGAYLFDTLEHANDYARWTERFKDGKFWQQFASSNKQVWEVQAYSFAPIEEHAAGRLSWWHGTPPEWHDVKQVARSQGAVACWLLLSEGKVGIFQVYPARGTQEETVRFVRSRSSLGQLVDGTLEVDRILPFITLWLPRSRALGGKENHSFL